jgi:hypothetical protein
MNARRTDEEAKDVFRVVDAPMQLVRLTTVVDTNLNGVSLLYVRNGLRGLLTQTARRRPVHLEYIKCGEMVAISGARWCTTGIGAGLG